MNIPEEEIEQRLRYYQLLLIFFSAILIYLLRDYFVVI